MRLSLPVQSDLITMQVTQSRVLDMDKWAELARDTAVVYQGADPYPYTQFDNFLEPDAARQAMEAFPQVGGEGWIHYLHVNEKKHGLNKMDRIPGFLQEVIRVLNSEAFIQHLERLTGIPHLLPDPSLEGGGLHQSQRGGYLNVHADFTVHPHKRNWRRRVNVLVYLNENWLPEYGGDLELWSRDMKACKQKISPVFNRCVVFNTDEDSYHGLPEPIQCPDTMSRKSIALYYFTEEADTPVKRATNYRARPEDGARSILIYLDKQLVNLYTMLKGWLGINDDVVSKILKIFNRKR